MAKPQQIFTQNAARGAVIATDEIGRISGGSSVVEDKFDAIVGEDAGIGRGHLGQRKDAIDLI